MATTFSRRLLSGAATVVFAKTVYPICTPHVDNGLVLHPQDPFLLETRSIAKKLGILHPEELQVHISNGVDEGGAIGANFSWLIRSSITISEEVYLSFFDECDEWEMTPNEVRFILAHECVHLAENHPMTMASFVPVSMMASVAMVSRIGHPVISTLISIGLMTTSGLLLSWRMEYEADHKAASLGPAFLQGGVSTFERTLRRNCMLKQLYSTKFITKDGNYIVDTSHPWLTSRINHLKHLNDDDCACFSFLELTKQFFSLL